MRKLALEDKAEANKIANECGTQIISDLSTLAQCELRLLHTKEDFFSAEDSSPFAGKPASVDGDVPVLLLCTRKGS